MLMSVTLQNSRIVNDQVVEKHDPRRSPAEQGSPFLSHQALTTLLFAMAAVPIIVIAVLWNFLPPVHEGELQANVYAEGVPPDEFYEVRYDQRPTVSDGFLVVQNNSDEDWTMLNIQVNKNYQIYDTEPILANSKRKFKLDKFITRSGARFSLRYNPLKSVMIYARLPSSERATYSYEF